MQIKKWFGFENEDHEGSSPGEYADFADQIELDATSQSEHDEFVRRVSREYGFPLSDWTPKIASRTRA